MGQGVGEETPTRTRTLEGWGDRRRIWRRAIAGLFCLLMFSGGGSGRAIEIEVPGPDFPSGCPADVEILIPELLVDLPGYANRAIQRTSPDYVPRFVILAALPEFEPLPQGPGPNNPPVSRLPSREEPPELEGDIQQVFFTTLERYYAVSESVQYEQYHWLFLGQTAEGWRLTQMFSRTSYPQGAIPTPPRDSTDSEIARAIRLWLRDCRQRE